MRSDYISHSSSLSSSTSINRKRKSDRGTSRERLKPDPGSTNSSEADFKRSKSGQSSPSNGQQPLLVSVLNQSTDEKKSRSKSKSKLASKSPKSSSDRHHRSERKHRDRRKDTNGVIVSSGVGGGVQTDASGLMITTPVTVPNIKMIVKQTTKVTTPVPSPMAQIQTVCFIRLFDKFMVQF